jgi:hypothetical protein
MTFLHFSTFHVQQKQSRRDLSSESGRTGHSPLQVEQGSPQLLETASFN